MGLILIRTLCLDFGGIVVDFYIFCRTLRTLFKVDPANYMMSICGSDALRELSSPGKSGSFFYLTNDDKYMIKTVKKSEVKVSSILFTGEFMHVDMIAPFYYSSSRTNPNY